jgi:hypothetical protein
MKSFLAVMTLLVVAQVAVAQPPYKGMETRSIKALSDQQIADLKNGRGMGLALSAELNGYPGPIHVLELSDQLGLSADQKSRIENLFESMKAEAVPVGVKTTNARGGLGSAIRHAFDHCPKPKADDGADRGNASRITKHSPEISSANCPNSFSGSDATLFNAKGIWFGSTAASSPEPVSHKNRSEDAPRLTRGGSAVGFNEAADFVGRGASISWSCDNLSVRAIDF